LGVNQRFGHGVRELAAEVGRGGITAGEARSRLNGLAQNHPRHPGWLVDLAVGAACASFGRLLGVDWVAFGPVFVGAAVAQTVRRRLAAGQVNVFIAATLVSFWASAFAGLGALLVQSFTVDTAMIASILLLVPGVPSLNAQNDILEGHPTLGSARAVSVAVTLVFLTVGVWISQLLLGDWRLAASSNAPAVGSVQGVPHLLHQTVFGGLAAVGFGVLFNMGPRALIWSGAGGALGLAIRTIGLQMGWTLEGASFAAALAVGGVVQLFHGRTGLSRNTLAAAACIPMIPGGFAAKAILGLFALTAPTVHNADQMLLVSVQDAVRVMFTVGALGTGLAIPSMLLRGRAEK
jgi:uncharacterized membrane protein YjjP (DUF1212 family)